MKNTLFCTTRKTHFQKFKLKQKLGGIFHRAHISEDFLTGNYKDCQEFCRSNDFMYNLSANNLAISIENKKTAIFFKPKIFYGKIYPKDMGM